MVDLARYAKFYGMAGALCFLLSIEFTMLSAIGILIIPNLIPIFFSVLGCIIGVILLAISAAAKSREALNHGIITLVLNVIALVFVLLIMYGIKIEI